ncbi:MAG: branched-chain amino acid ABC transporter permease [Bacillota bacterium]
MVGRLSTVFQRGERLAVPLGLAAVAAGAVGLAAVPLVASRFYVYFVMQMMVLGMFALAFNLLYGHAGLLSFGHAAFYATGAYVAGLALKHGGVSILPAVAGGVAAAAALGLVVGFFSVRHTDIYFSMLTLAFGQMVYSLAWKWVAVTGGDNGLIGIPRAPLVLLPGVRVPLDSLFHYYYLVLAAFVASVWILHRLSRSPFGLTLNGLRENAERVAFSGISVRRVKLVAFVISAAVAGLAGSLVAPLENTVSPAAAHWTKSAEPVLASLIGGTRTFAGPVVGAAVFMALKEAIERRTEYWLVALGVALVAIVLGFRSGILGTLAGLLHKAVPAPSNGSVAARAGEGTEAGEGATPRLGHGE